MSGECLLLCSFSYLGRTEQVGREAYKNAPGAGLLTNGMVRGAGYDWQKKTQARLAG